MNNHDWLKETDKELLNRLHYGNVIGIAGNSYWERANLLRDELRSRNLV